MSDKYNRKYNLISFILLRKKEEFLNDTMLNDQILYEQVDTFVSKGDLAGLKQFFTENPALASFVNGYNSSLFVYTIRKCLEETAHNSIAFNHSVMEFLFDKKIRPPSFYYLIDGDYPKRNLVHYAARYNSVRMLELIRDALKEDLEERELAEGSAKTTNEETNSSNVKNKDDMKILQDLLLQVSYDLINLFERYFLKRTQLTIIFSKQALYSIRFQFEHAHSLGRAIQLTRRS